MCMPAWFAVGYVDRSPIIPPIQMHRWIKYHMGAYIGILGIAQGRLQAGKARCKWTCILQLLQSSYLYYFCIISRMYYEFLFLSRLLSDSRHDAGLLLLELSSKIPTIPRIPIRLRALSLTRTALALTTTGSSTPFWISKTFNYRFWICQ